MLSVLRVSTVSGSRVNFSRGKEGEREVNLLSIPPPPPSHPPSLPHLTDSGSTSLDNSDHLPETDSVTMTGLPLLFTVCSPEEKRKMLEMLKRLEAEEEEEVGDEDDGDATVSLAERLAGLDLGKQYMYFTVSLPGGCGYCYYTVSLPGGCGLYIALFPNVMYMYSCLFCTHLRMT